MARKEASAAQPTAPLLRFDVPGLPPERVSLPAPYDAHWVDFALDVSERELTQIERKADLLARVVTDWSMTAGGAPAPRTAAAFEALRDQAPTLVAWLELEYWTRRNRPLAAAPTSPNGASSLPPTT